MGVGGPGGGISDFAVAVRVCVERCLSEPARSWHVATDTSSWVAPVDDLFNLERVALREDRGTSILDVIFRWDGEPELFGISYAITDHGLGLDAPDAFISIYVEEDLVATGRGIENAHRVLEDGVTWLDWKGSSCLKR